MKHQPLVSIGMAIYRSEYLENLLSALKNQTYTNVEYILSFLPETKQLQADVQAYGTQLQNQLQSKIADFQSKAENFQKNATSMTDVIRADKQEELQIIQASTLSFHFVLFNLLKNMEILNQIMNTAT